MVKRYIPSVAGRGLVPVNVPGYQAPTPVIEPLINKPGQTMPVTQPPPQDYEQGAEWFSTVYPLANQLATMQTVQTIEVRQPANQIAAPRRTWNRLNWQMPYITGRQDRYPMVGLTAPARLQSVPGYVVTQSQVTLGSQVNATQAQNNQNLKAPGINTGTGGCK